MTLPQVDSISSQRRWTIVGLLCLANVVAYFDRVNLSMALTDPSFKAFFHLTDLQRGMLNSAFFWSYALFQIPAGWFTDRFGVKFPYAISFLAWSLVSAAAALTGGFWQLFALRMLLGFAESPVTPAGMRWIRFNCSENQRGLAVGLFMAAAKVGPGVGPYIAALLLMAYGWRPMFVILGLGSLLWLIPWMGIVKDDDRKIEKAAVAAAGRGPSFGRVLANPVIWGIVVGTFCYQYFVYFCMTWMPAYFAERRGLSLERTGFYTMFSFLGMAIVATAAGWIADRLIDRGMNPISVRKGFIFAGFITASTEIFGAFAESNSAALFWAIFSLSGLGLMTANYWALTQSILPNAAIGRVVGVQNCAASVSGIAASLITGWLKQVTGSYQAPMQTIWVFLLLGIASYAFVVRKKYAPSS